MNSSRKTGIGRVSRRFSTNIATLLSSRPKAPSSVRSNLLEDESVASSRRSRKKSRWKKKVKKSKKKKKKLKKKGRSRKKDHYLFSDRGGSFSPLSQSNTSSFDDSDSNTQIRKRDRRRGRSRKPSSLSPSSSSSSWDTDSQESDFLTREELFELPAKELRKRCRHLRLDTSAAVDKSDLVRTLHNYYRLSASEMAGSADKAIRGSQRTGNDFRVAGGHPFAAGMYGEMEQMVEVLQEIVPFFGQGDQQSDTIVRETIGRLPPRALEIPDPLGNTILMLACQSGAYELVPTLLSKGSDANAQNNDGVTCLHFACYTDSFSPQTAQLLVENGAKAEVIEHQFGCTPLHWAAFAGHKDLCSLLCDAGASPRTVDKNGCDPIAYAKQSNSNDCVQYLMSVSTNENPARPSLISVPAGKLENMSEWEKIVDDQSGEAYFHNASTGQSLWEDEYTALSTSRGPPAPPTSLDAKIIDRQTEAMPVLPELPPPPHPNGRTPLVRNDGQGAASDVRDFGESSLSDMSEPSHLAPKHTPLDSPEPQEGIVLKSQSQSQVSKTSSQIDAHTNPTTLSPIPKSPAIEAMNTLTKDTFEERLAALQSKMEEQFVDQLGKIEGKITAQQDAHVDIMAEKTNETLVEMTSKVVQLQADIGSKDLEILSLKRDIVALETQLATSADQEKVSMQTRDVLIGDGDLTEDLWVESKEMRSIADELESKTKRLADLNEHSNELQAKFTLAERNLLALQDKYELAERQIAAVEETLRTERAAKEDVMDLLEQTKQGVEVGAEVTRSLKEEKAKDAGRIARLELDLRTLETRKADELAAIASQLGHKEECFVSENKKVVSLTEEVSEIRNALVEEQRKLVKTEKNHAIEMQELINNHARKISSMESSMMEQHRLEKDGLQGQLKEERLARMEKELERNDAVHAKESAIEQSLAAEAKLQEMSTMIKEAKILHSVNERLHRALHVETDRRKTLHNKLEDLKGRIRVYVRIRPLSSSETERQCQNALIKEDKRTCVMNADTDKGTDAKSWEFDQIFCGTADDGNTQEEVFQDTRLLITSAVDGFNVCIFAYGQTGSGKTYTMFGPGGISEDMKVDGNMNENCGLAPRAAEELFRVLKERDASCHTQVEVTMFELYNDSLRDLFVSRTTGRDQALRIKLAEHSGTGMVEVEGAAKEKVDSAEELLALFRRGSLFRTTASTDMNADSSRSHLITSMVITVTNKRTGRAVRGKLTLVDLAGSERVSKSGATGRQLKEAQSINKSLSALGDVIGALTSGSQHVPYRNHPLTMLMSDSIGGTAKTLMFVCCSPADYNRSESANSLDFSKRCKDVTNDVGGGSGEQSSQVRALRSELARMRKEKGASVRRKVAARRPGM